MSEKTIGEILAMSGYGFYVWAAFIVSLLSVAGLFFYSQYRLNKAIKNNKNLDALLK